MRSLLVATLLVLFAAAPAGADYRRLPGPPPDDDLVLANGVVIVGAGSALTYHLPDGGGRTGPSPGGARLIEEVDVSGAAAAILAIKGGGSDRAFYGPLAGPFERLTSNWIDVAVSGSEVIFTVGACVFAGPGPAPGARLPPVAAEGCLRSTDGG